MSFVINFSYRCFMYEWQFSMKKKKPRNSNNSCHSNKFSVLAYCIFTYKSKKWKHKIRIRTEVKNKIITLSVCVFCAIIIWRSQNYFTIFPSHKKKFSYHNFGVSLKEKNIWVQENFFLCRNLNNRKFGVWHSRYFKRNRSFCYQKNKHTFLIWSIEKSWPIE